MGNRIMFDDKMYKNTRKNFKAIKINNKSKYKKYLKIKNFFFYLSNFIYYRFSLKTLVNILINVTIFISIFALSITNTGDSNNIIQTTSNLTSKILTSFIQGSLGIIIFTFLKKFLREFSSEIIRIFTAEDNND